MRRLVAVLCALVVALGVGVAWFMQAPSDAELRSRVQETPVSPRPSSVLWDSPSLLAEMVKTRAKDGEDVRFLIGSSELTQSIEDSAYPVRFFQDHNFGFRLMCIGGAGYQSLWSAIETAALDEEGAIPGKKIALLLGTCWFYEGGCTTEAFFNSFSEEAFAECLSNPALSEATKERLKKRVEELGVDAEAVERLSGVNAIEGINRAINDIATSGERRQELADAINSSCVEQEGVDQPLETNFDWDALFDEVAEQGAAACTNNEIGINDWYYTEYAEKWIADNKSKTFESFDAWSDEEFSDLSLFLDVCRELEIEPLLVIEPAKGQYYDTGTYDQESRERFYSRMREFLDESGVGYLDLSGHGYDLYYLRDVQHMAWKGWAEIDRALVEFYGGDQR